MNPIFPTPETASSLALSAESGASGTSYLFFDLRSASYALETSLVREIVQRPALSPLVQAPSWVVGALDLRGRVAPVIDLDARLGQSPRGVDAADHVIFVEHRGRLSGLLVGAVHEVRSVAPESVEAAPAAAWSSHLAPHVRGVTRVDGALVSLLDLDALLPLDSIVDEAPTSQNASPDEGQPILQARAQALRIPTPRYGESEGIGPLALAIVALGGELWGIDLGMVREFCPVGNVAPVPCCPPHIIGQINLRGDVLTLVDIRAWLELSTATPTVSKKAGAPNMTLVVQADEFRVGVPVDEVLDVRRLEIGDVWALPSAANARNQFVRGTAAWNDSILSLLDLNALLAHGELWVDEDV